MDNFVNFYLENREDKIRKKWKMIDFLMDEEEENEEKLQKDYYSISKLRNILKKLKNV